MTRQKWCIVQEERFGHWKDTAIMLEGEAVQNLTMLFLQMWNITQMRADDFTKYLTPKSLDFKRELGYVLPYGDSPYDNEIIGEQVYFHILNHAKKYVHIMTPYLLNDPPKMVYCSSTHFSTIIVPLLLLVFPNRQNLLPAYLPSNLSNLLL